MPSKSGSFTILTTGALQLAGRSGHVRRLCQRCAPVLPPPSLLGCLTPHPCSARNNAHLNRRHCNSARLSARPDQHPHRCPLGQGPNSLPQPSRLSWCNVAWAPTWAHPGNRTTRRSRRPGLCKGAQPATPEPATGTRREREPCSGLVGTPHDDKRPRLLPLLRVRHGPRPRPRLQDGGVHHI